MKTSGITLIKRTIECATASLDKTIRQFGTFVAGIDASITADLSNDPDMTAAMSAIQRAKELCPPSEVDLMATLIQAENRQREAMAKDFSDTTKERLKAYVVPFFESLKKSRDGLAGLQGTVFSFALG